MLKGTTIINRPKVYHRMLGLRREGKSDHEIAEILGITAATVEYVASINSPDRPAEYDDRGREVDRRLKIAYEMRQSGQSFAEIARKLQVSIPRARQMVHRYKWILRH